MHGTCAQCTASLRHCSIAALQHCSGSPPQSPADLSAFFSCRMEFRLAEVVPRSTDTSLGGVFGTYLGTHGGARTPIPTLQQCVLLHMAYSEDPGLHGALFDLTWSLRAQVLATLVSFGPTSPSGSLVLPEATRYVLRSDAEMLEALDEYVAALQEDLEELEEDEAGRRGGGGREGGEEEAHLAASASASAWPRRVASGYVTQAELDKIRAYPHPPPFVDAVCEALCIVLGRPPMFSQQIRHDRHLLRYLDDVEPRSLGSATLAALYPYVSAPEFHDPRVGGRICEDAVGLASLVVDMYRYARFAEHPELSLVRHLYKRVFHLQSLLLHIDSASYSHRYKGSAAEGADLYLDLDAKGPGLAQRRVQNDRSLSRSVSMSTAHFSAALSGSSRSGARPSIVLPDVEVAKKRMMHVLRHRDVVELQAYAAPPPRTAALLQMLLLVVGREEAAPSWRPDGLAGPPRESATASPGVRKGNLGREIARMDPAALEEDVVAYLGQFVAEFDDENLARESGPGARLWSWLVAVYSLAQAKVSVLCVKERGEEEEGRDDGDDGDDDDEEEEEGEDAGDAGASGVVAKDGRVITRGARVRVRGYVGVVRTLTKTHFDLSGGTWVGVEFEDRVGKHNGTVDGVEYFAAAAKSGLFVRPGLIELDDPEGTTKVKTPVSSVHAKKMERSAGRQRKVGTKAQSRRAILGLDHAKIGPAHARSGPKRPRVEVGDTVSCLVPGVEGLASGVVRFKGSVHFGSGTWFGIELDTGVGSSDGTVGGKWYFLALPKHGIFLKRGRFALSEDADDVASISSISPPEA